MSLTLRLFDGNQYKSYQDACKAGASRIVDTTIDESDIEKFNIHGDSYLESTLMHCRVAATCLDGNQDLAFVITESHHPDSSVLFTLDESGRGKWIPFTKKFKVFLDRTQHQQCSVIVEATSFEDAKALALKMEEQSTPFAMNWYLVDTEPTQLGNVQVVEW